MLGMLIILDARSHANISYFELNLYVSVKNAAQWQYDWQWKKDLI